MDAATMAQLEMYYKSLEETAPYREMGKRALPMLERYAGMSGVSPLFKMQQAEGEKAINRSLAARGLWNSGAGVQALSDFNRKLSATEADKKWGRLASLVNIGQGMSAQSGQNAVNTGSNLATIYQTGYSDIAQSNAGMYSGINQAAQGGLQNYMFAKYAKLI